MIILFGVSGSGKTTIGKSLAARLNCPFYDADDYHPESNILKMKKGVPLQDEDRWPWLNLLAENIKQWSKQGEAVLACSALKETYRNVLRSAQPNTIFIHLEGSFDLIQQRVMARKGHFMPEALLKSQFDALETTTYAISISIDQTKDSILNEILEKIQQMQKNHIGLIGLGVMGKSLALNFADHNIDIAVFNRSDAGEEHIVPDFLESNKQYENLSGYTDLKTFVQSLSLPHRIFLMVSAGKAVDAVIQQLLPLLQKGDIIMDGGNSFFKETQRRFQELSEKGIHFIGIGVSGGEKGARFGPSIMPGGSPEAYSSIAHFLEPIAAKDKYDAPCCTHVGKGGGAGHFVKMVHNGIEYAEMQLIAELYALLKTKMDYTEMSELFAKWNESEAKSYLLEITATILQKREGGGYLLDFVLDKAGNKGTGSWSSKEAMDLGEPNTMMAAAVFARYVSAFPRFSTKNINHSKTASIDLGELHSAYQAARLLNHHQGFAVIQAASEHYNWDINLSELARIWTNGCIIRSTLMENLSQMFKTHDELLSYPDFFEKLTHSESALAETLKHGLDLRVPMPCFSAAHSYWISRTSERLSANLIQAQRDFFGAHTYKRIDAPESQSFHTDWS